MMKWYRGRPDETEEYTEKRIRGNIISKSNLVNSNGKSMSKIIETDVDIRDFNRHKKHLGDFVETETEVKGTRDKMMGVSRERLVPVLVKAFQQQQDIIDGLISRIEALEA